MSDIVALRSKYSALVASRDMHSHLHVASSSPDALSAVVATGDALQSDTTAPQASSCEEGRGRLSLMRICDMCRGLGVVKELYNHMITEKTCRRCEGDGVVEPKPLSPGSRLEVSLASGASDTSQRAAQEQGTRLSTAPAGLAHGHQQPENDVPPLEDAS